MIFKTEGSSITWGQSISEIDTSSDANVYKTTQSVVPAISPSAAPPVIGQTNTPDNSEPSAYVLPVVPVDTVVEVVKNTISSDIGSSLGCKAASSIAMAAASSNNAVAVVSDKDFVSSLSRGLQGQILASVSTIVPNTSTKVIVAGSTVNTKDDIKKALTEAQKIDLSITLRSKKSEKIEFNNVKRPFLKTDFVYNYFTQDEEDIEIQEDQARDPLLKRRPVDVPRYVSLQWDITEATAPLRYTEDDVRKNSKLRQESFGKVGGTFGSDSSNVPFSVTQQAKNKNPYVQDGLVKSVVDIHQPDVAFSSISNSQVFSNTVSVTVNTNKQKRLITDFPAFQIK